jgi:hypothetical protein
VPWFVLLPLPPTPLMGSRGVGRSRWWLSPAPDVVSDGTVPLRVRPVGRGRRGGGGGPASFEPAIEGDCPAGPAPSSVAGRSDDVAPPPSSAERGPFSSASVPGPFLSGRGDDWCSGSGGGGGGGGGRLFVPPDPYLRVGMAGGRGAVSADADPARSPIIVRDSNSKNTSSSNSDGDVRTAAVPRDTDDEEGGARLFLRRGAAVDEWEDDDAVPSKEEGAPSARRIAAVVLVLVIVVVGIVVIVPET